MDAGIQLPWKATTDGGTHPCNLDPGIPCRDDDGTDEKSAAIQTAKPTFTTPFGAERGQPSGCDSQNIYRFENSCHSSSSSSFRSGKFVSNSFTASAYSSSSPSFLYERAISAMVSGMISAPS